MQTSLKMQSCFLSLSLPAFLQANIQDWTSSFLFDYILRNITTQSPVCITYYMLLILLTFHVNHAKYNDSTSSICVCSKSSLAVVHSSPVTDIRAKIQLPKLENANVRSTTTPSCRKSILEIVDCSVKTELGPALTTEPSSYIYKV